MRSNLISSGNKCLKKIIFLQRVQLLITVVDYDRVGASEPIGKVLLGCDQKGPELRHWSEMLASPRRPVAQWHTLKEIESKSICLICPHVSQSFGQLFCKSSLAIYSASHLFYRFGKIGVALSKLNKIESSC